MSALYPTGINKTPLAKSLAARLFAFALLTALLTFAAVHSQNQAQAQENFTITGKVINGTEGASSPVGITVLLLVTGADTRLIATDHTSTLVDGRFEFQQVPVVGDGVYAFSVDYAQVFYEASLSLGDLSSEIELTVYETTQDASAVKVTNQVMVIGDIDEKNKTISAIEFVRLTNSSDRTLLPDLNLVPNNAGEISFLRFALPPLAEELDVGTDMPGGDIISIGSGFALTSPVLPGDHFVDYSFRFPYQGYEVSYRQSLPQGADVYRVMVPLRLSTVGIDPLQPVTPVEQEGGSYRAWEGYDYQPGQGLTLRLTGLPQPSLGARLEKSISSGAFWKVAIPSAMGAVLVFLLLLGILKPRLRVETPMRSTSGGVDRAPVGPSPVDREAAIRQIASLDERFLEGDVAEADYLSERETLVNWALGHEGPAEQDPQLDQDLPADEQPLDR